MSVEKINFEDFITLQRGFDLPRSKMKDGDVPVLGSNCVIGYHNESKVEPPGVITGRSGTLGVVQYAEEPYWPHNTSLWVKDFKGNYPKFVFYKLKTLGLENYNGGASVPTLNRNSLDTIKVVVPGTESQIRIADILSAYDSLIENNRRRIQLLEQSARMLYKEWFVHLRFPGHEHVKIKKGMPEGWERKNLEELALITMGQSPKSKYYNIYSEGLPFHQGVSDFGDRFVSNQTYCTVSNRLAEANDILCSVRAPVGRLNITLDKIIIGRGLSALKSKSGHQSYLFYQLRSHFFKEDMIGGGAIFASVTKEHLLSQRLLTAADNLIKVFEDITGPLDEQIKNLFLQNRRLREARDILLPKLIGGEVKV